MRRAGGSIGPLFTFMLLAALLTACSSPAQPVLGRVFGTVTIDGAPAQGITVTLSSGGDQRGRLLTDSDGGYNFIGTVRAGGYRLAISGFPSGVTFPTTFYTFRLTETFELEFDFTGTTG